MKVFWRWFAIFINTTCLAALCLSYLAPFIDPRTSTIAAFFGLSYPFWLIATLLSTLFALIYKMGVFKYNVVVLALGIPFLIRYISFHNPEPRSEHSFRIAAFNTNGFGAQFGKNNLPNIRTFLDSSNTDFAVLIEFRNQNEGVLKAKLPNYHTFHGRNKKVGIHVATRFEVVNRGQVYIGEQTYGMITFTDIVIHASDTIRIYGVHLESNKLKPRDYYQLRDLRLDSSYQEHALSIRKRIQQSMQQRAMQVNALQYHMKDCRYRSIICGDFNDTPHSFTYQELKYGKKDAFIEKGSGWESSFLKPFPLLRIDYLLYDPELKCTNYQSTDDIFSDHKLIFADLELK
ncbi:MAG: endonuclease/exonuclease/phosphatase family metal-dependent hydrolase [Bacteroidia bacterium]|jgi:endonuclease/exonuclease/phosphatase family metal-dependent hydrolase